MKLCSAAALVLLCLMLQLSTVPSRADDDHFACMNDAMSICGQFIPDRERVARCLMANRGRVSLPCRAALKRFK